MTRILFLEDSADDMELMLHQLREAGFSCTSKRIDKKREFLRAVNEFKPSVILADYSLPMFTGMEAFRMLKRKGISIPFILVTGALSEQLALECVKEGVDDFILKSSFGRLPSAVNNAMQRKKVENERERIGRELKRSHRDLQKLTERLQVMREEERLSIARDMHDELGQVLTGLKIDISMLWKKISSGRANDPTEIDSEFSSIVGLVNQVMKSVKRIYSGLRPEILDELGIVEAIRWQCQEFELRNKIECRAVLDVESLDVDRNFSIALYRIVQEALTNVAKHANAKRVEVLLSQSEETLLLSITDNGIGISLDSETQPGALGIIGLRERVRFLNGKFVLSGKPGKGTRVLVTVPVKQTYAVEQD
jgi:signal transduction histidine kinase